MSLDIHNVVDITSTKNVEIAVRIKTDVENKDRDFYTDLNGFQVSGSVHQLTLILPNAYKYAALAWPTLWDYFFV